MAANREESDRNETSWGDGETTDSAHYQPLKGMAKLWQTGVHSDVKIHVKDKTFNCHKAILVAASSYFEAMFSSGMREAVSGEVTFHDMEPNIMENMLEFIYTGKGFVTEENVIQVLEMSLLLGIKTISQICESLLAQKLNIENCMEVLELSYTHNLEGLKAKVLAFIPSNFLKVMEQNNFSNLKVDDFTEFIKCDDLNVPSEDIVLESVLKWAYHKEKHARQESLNKILPHMRLGHLSVETLLSIKNQGFTVSADVQAKLDEALDYRMLPARRQEMDSTVMQYRKSFPFEEVLVVLGQPVVCNGSNETRETPLFAFSFLQQKWFKLSNVPYIDEASACCHGNDIFLFGGKGEQSKDMQRYSAASNKWTTSTCMYESRMKCAVVAMTGKIYLLGGLHIDDTVGRRILSSIEKYDIATRRSVYCTDLPKPTYLHSQCNSTAVSGRNVFIFGEFYNSETSFDFERTYSCYVWNTVTNEFTLVTQLAHQSRFLKTVQSAGRIYVVQLRKIVEFSENGDCKLLTQKLKLNCIYYDAVPHKGHLLILGGLYKGDNDFSTEIQHFNTETNDLTKYSNSLPKPMFINSCFKIEIDKRFLNNQV